MIWILLAAFTYICIRYVIAVLDLKDSNVSVGTFRGIETFVVIFAVLFTVAFAIVIVIENADGIWDRISFYWNLYETDAKVEDNCVRVAENIVSCDMTEVK